MKRFGIVGLTAFFSTLALSPAAESAQCLAVQGALTAAGFDGSCTIKTLKGSDKYYADVDWLPVPPDPQPPLCFKGNFQGSLGGSAIIGTFNSGVSNDVNFSSAVLFPGRPLFDPSNPVPQTYATGLSAATVLGFNYRGNFYRVFFRDRTFLPSFSVGDVLSGADLSTIPTTEELLVAVGGTRDPQGTVHIVGDLVNYIVSGNSAPLAPTLSGRICFN